MGYCGTLLVYYLSQISGVQLKGIGSDSALYAFIGTYLIPQAEKIVDGFCNHSFGTPTIGTWLFDGNGKNTLFLPPTYYPMIGVSAGSVNSSSISGNIKVYPQYLRLTSGNFLAGKQNVVIYGSHGYTAIPEDVTYATAQVAANMLVDMVKKNIAPDAFKQVLFSGSGQGGGENIASMFNTSMILNNALKEILLPYQVNWVDIGGKE